MQKYKIVQTIEKGEYKLSAVPESWENQGNLRWPKVKWEKLRRDPYSTPEDSWRSINCILKRKDIMSFREAEAELSAMSDVTDTDQENVTHNMLSKPLNKEKDFNTIARQCFQTIETKAQIHTSPSASKNRLNPTKTLQTAVDGNETTLSKNNQRMESEIREYLVFSPANSKPEAVQPVQVQAYEYRENVPEIENFNSDILITHAHEEISKEFGEQQVSMTNKDVLMATTKDLSVKFTALETKVDNFIANQIIITLNQEQIMLKLSEISAQFEEFIKRSSTLHLTRTEDLNKGIKNISNEEGLNEFEELLKDKQNVDDMTKVYSVVCGQGKGRAINNAYALSDAMFDRNFLNQCSWAGGSRGETSKICFKSYKRTINFFFKIIHASDKQFTTLECESFFKNILRNSKKRSECKQLKRSAQKNRQKRKKMENKENESPVRAIGETKGPVVIITNEERGSVREENSERRSINEIELVNQELEDEIVNAQNLLFQETEV